MNADIFRDSKVDLYLLKNGNLRWKLPKVYMSTSFFWGSTTLQNEVYNGLATFLKDVEDQRQ